MCVYHRAAGECVEHVEEDETSESHCRVSGSDHLVLHLIIVCVCERERERVSVRTSFLKTQSVPATMVKEVVTIWNKRGRVTILSEALRGGLFITSWSTGSTPRLTTTHTHSFSACIYIYIHTQQMHTLCVCMRICTT